MKVTRTSVHRLTVEKTCGCKATREYEDVRYTKPLSEGEFTACDKHEKNKMIAEFAGEMLLEALDKEAETAGKTANVAPQNATPTSLSGTSGESVQSMPIPKIREKRDPLAPKVAQFTRPDAHKPSTTSYGNLNVAPPEDLTPEEMQEAGITITGDIDGVAADPRVDAALREGLGSMEDIFDAEDAKSQGVPLSVLRDAE